MRLTVRQYITGFKSLWGYLAGLAFLSPLLGISKASYTEYLHPPLGDSENYALLLAFGLLFFILVIVFHFTPTNGQQRTRWLILAGSVFLVSGMVLLALCDRYTVRFEYKTKTVPASIGWTRTEFALKTFGDKTDREMLNEYGVQEQQIRELWTSNSIMCVRLLLFTFYVAVLGSLFFALCLLVYQHATDIASAPHTP